jgi:methionyl-tRNA formyltransferase
MDAGDVLLQERTPIRLEDTGETLSNRLAEIGAKLLLEGVRLVESGQARFTPQDHAQATYCKRFEKRDGQIDWSVSAERIHNLVRAAQPWPIAHCRFGNDVIRIFKTIPTTSPFNGVPGQVLAVERDRVVVATGDGALALLEVQAPGKRVMPMDKFLRGHAVRPGDRFESLP